MRSSSSVIHARRVAVSNWISSPGRMGPPVRASTPLYFAIIVLIVILYPSLIESTQYAPACGQCGRIQSGITRPA